MFRAVWGKAIWLASWMSIICLTSPMGNTKIIEIVTPEKTISKKSTDWLAQEHTHVLRSFARDICSMSEEFVYIINAVQVANMFDTFQDAMMAAKGNEIIKQMAISMRYKCRKSKVEDCIIDGAMSNADGIYTVTHCMNKEVRPLYVELCTEWGLGNKEECNNRGTKWTENETKTIFKSARLGSYKFNCWEMSWYLQRRTWRDTQRICS